MAQGIFLGTSVINGVPTLFQYTMETGNPVVLVEKFTPSKEELLNPTPVSFDTGKNLDIYGGDKHPVVIGKINPLDYPEPLRQKLLSTPHLEKGVHCRVVPDEE
jgi:hypothetical protein